MPRSVSRRVKLRRSGNHGTSASPFVAPTLLVPRELAIPAKEGMGVLFYNTGQTRDAERGWKVDLGSGWRSCMVLCVGRKYITLFYPGTLTTIRLLVCEYAALKPRVVDVDWGVRARVIQKTMETYDANNLQYSHKNAELALRWADRQTIPLAQAA